MEEKGKVLRVFVNKRQTLEAFLMAININPNNVAEVAFSGSRLSILTSEIIKGVSIDQSVFVNIFLKEGVHLEYCPHSV
jgi:hypothetical protein